ncbi:MAG: MoaF N-terminal domain-containing protein [Clostridia bacterium]|nr:MoaF N-terminal domain-containing protein [Clostridia bacterium]
MPGPEIRYPNPFLPTAPWNGLEQFREPLCYDLKGRAFQLVMDNGCRYALHFLSEEMIAWGEQGKALRWDTYECLKLDDKTYFVNWEIFGTPLRHCLTLVLDLQADLVTAVHARIGEVKTAPYLVTHDIVFGAIKTPGKPLNPMRHAFTPDLTGKNIFWRYSSNFGITHAFITEHFLRVPIGQPRELPPDATQEQIRERDAEYERRKKHLFEIPAFYVKIREDVYFFGFIEETECRQDPTLCGNSLIMVMDTNKIHDIGRCFASDYENHYAPQNFVFSAFGAFHQTPDLIDGMPSPYRIF